MPTAEANVLSAVCKNKDIHTIVGEDPEIFGAFKDAATWMRDQYLKYRDVPSASLLETQFPDIDLPEVTAPTPFYMDALRAQFVESKMQEIMTGAAKAMETIPAPRVLEGLQTKLSRLNKYTTSVRDLDMTNIEDAEEHFKKLRKTTEDNGGTPGIATGFASIDSAYTSGLSGGHSIVCMGYTGRGKSMWATLLAIKAYQQGFKPMIISLEMTPEEQRERIYAMMGSGLFKISDLARGDVSLDNFREWGKKAFDKNNRGFVVVSNEGSSEVTPNTIQAKIDTHRPDIVILDYLQLMSDNGKTSAMTPRMLNLSREIKLLAVNNNIPIVSITAVTDEEKDKRDSPPVLSQVAWSKGIEYDANLVIAIHRHTDSNVVELVCRKSRHGELFNFYFLVDFDRGIWEEKFTLDDPQDT